MWNSGEYRGRTLSRGGRDPELRTQLRDSQRSVCLGGSTRGVGDDPWFSGGWPLGGYITVPFQLFWRRGFSVLRALKCSENEEQAELGDLLRCGAVEDSVSRCVPVRNMVPGVVGGLISCSRLCCVQTVMVVNGAEVYQCCGVLQSGTVLGDCGEQTGFVRIVSVCSAVWDCELVGTSSCTSELLLIVVHYGEWKTLKVV